MSPDFITFTGADDQTDHQDLLDLSEEYPVEFAILFSETKRGQPRYPTQKWINSLEGLDLSLAAHICGSWAHQIVHTGQSAIDDRLGMFDRVQINTADPLDIDLLCSWKSRIEDMFGREFRIILQTRDKFPEDDRLEWLFDASGGRGIFPDSWPKPPQKETVRLGYAGGLGPDNVLDAVKAINLDFGYWIDMETRIRNASDQFDLGLCRDVCRQLDL